MKVKKISKWSFHMKFWVKKRFKISVTESIPTRSFWRVKDHVKVHLYNIIFCYLFIYSVQKVLLSCYCIFLHKVIRHKINQTTSTRKHFVFHWKKRNELRSTFLINNKNCNYYLNYRLKMKKSKYRVKPWHH